MPDLTPQQQRFVGEYLVDLNGTKAAIRAGYSLDSAAQQASRLLSNAKIQDAVAEAQVERAARVECSADKVLRELARLGLSDPRKMFQDERLLQPSEWTDDIAAAIASMDVERRRDPGEDGENFTVTKIKFWDKNSALEKLCKHLGLFREDNDQANKPTYVIMSTPVLSEDEWMKQYGNNGQPKAEA